MGSIAKKQLLNSFISTFFVDSDIYQAIGYPQFAHYFQNLCTFAPTITSP